MEDFAIDIMIGKGASARSIRLDLPKFTLVGAAQEPDGYLYTARTINPKHPHQWSVEGNCQ